MNFVINGASGFVGKHLYNKLTKSGHIGMRISRKVLADDENSWKNDSRVNVLKHPKNYIEFKGSVFINLETKQSNFLNFLGNHDYEQVIVNGLKEWLAWCDQVGIDKIIHFSSVKAIKPSGMVSFETENNPNHSAYGFNKWKSEQVLKNWCQGKSTRKCSILRAAPIYGQGCSGKVRTLAILASKGLRFTVGSFNPKISLVSINNVISATEHLSNILKPGCEIYNICNYEDLDLTSLLQLFSNYFDNNQNLRSANNFLPVFTKIGNIILSKSLHLFAGHMDFRGSFFNPKKLIDTGFKHPESARESLENYCNNLYGNFN